MQKFTRVLTREVEIGGERLAVTLAAEGITIRPVGSRRPPHTMTWASVVSCMVGKLPTSHELSPEETKAVLEALHKGARHAKGGSGILPAAMPLTPKIPPITPYLERLERWLGQHRQRYFETLLPPASADEIDGLARVIGQPLSDEVWEWLGWHNGQNEDFGGSFYETFNLLSAAQIAAAWQDRQSNPEPGWQAGWVPLLDDYQGDLIVLDPSQPGCAVREVWRGRSEHPVVAPTLAKWLDTFVSDVEAGRYNPDPERGEFRRS